MILTGAGFGRSALGSTPNPRHMMAAQKAHENGRQAMRGTRLKVCASSAPEQAVYAGGRLATRSERCSAH